MNPPIEERAQDFYNAVFDAALLHLLDVAEGEAEPTEEDRADGVTDEYDARQRIEEMGYGVSKETVYYVMLAGGGPAARLKVVADRWGDVEEATLQFQDWFEPWTDAPHQDAELVRRYARLLADYEEQA
jgi:hypothetical protein